MRRVINRVVVVAFVIVTVLFILFLCWDGLHRNHAPVISCDTDTLAVSIADGEEALLRGVTAIDKEDGDLSDQVIVESVSAFIERGVCRVTYAVADKQNAVAKLSRTVQYTDYTSPRYALSAPLRFPYSKVIDPMTVLSVTDCIDGDISDQAEASLIGDSRYITGEGDWDVHFTVTNSKGETAEITTTVVVGPDPASKPYTPNIQLTEYLVYVPKGTAFDAAKYIQSVSAQNTQESPAELRTHVHNNAAETVDTDQVGSYTVTYTCTSAENYEGSVNLVVVVYDPSL